MVWKRRAHVKFVYVGSLSWKTKGSVSSQHVNKKHSRNFIPISRLGDLSSPERNSSQEEYLDLLSQKTFFANTSRAKESLGHRISVYDSGNNPGDVY
ncbi:uncharacterized protein LOC117122187 isoform X2 [Anneissia japonica]|uniref:uncharacterized protein LOC117122187 isoform X2 n=1 Tax=Anneissia japonica TaxID=1529436 RepID=UPI0014257A50|nr:uncharacterized protein LOC117122187 isoform X2 [Anneissia japonica]